jgi:hypothetical protein
MGKNPPNQETLDFLERTVHRVGETSENQRKTREKTKVAENQVFWLDFCAKKKNCAYPLWLIALTGLRHKGFGGFSPRITFPRFSPPTGSWIYYYLLRGRRIYSQSRSPQRYKKNQ